MGSCYAEGLRDHRDYDLKSTRCLLARATVAVVDPKLSSFSAKAHEWLPSKPGQDGARARVIAHD